MLDKSMLSHDSDEWKTPNEFFKLLDDEFHFDLDPCTTKENNLKTKYFFTKHDESLFRTWFFNDNYNLKNIFINSPYSIEDEFILKSYHESLKGCNCVLLIYAKTDKSIWHDLIFPYAKQIRFIRGRINFVGGEHTSTKGSAVVIFSNTLYYNNKIIYYPKSINKYFLDKQKTDIKKEVKELF